MSFEPKPTDYEQLLAQGIPEPRFVKPPYFPEAAFVLSVGPAESGKSIFAMALGAELSRQGRRVIHISQENPLEVELSRLAGLRPDPRNFVFYHYQGFDLAIPDHVDTLAQIAEGAALITVDTWSACWSGDENDNAAVASFDRDVVRPLIAYTGATVHLLDHTGHPQAFVSRSGIAAARGASAKGQKADVMLVFASAGPSEFEITHAKNRHGGGRKEPVRRFRVEEDEDAGTLELVQVATAADRRTREVAEAIVEFLRNQHRVVGSAELRAAMREACGAGVELVRDAVKLLDGEDPPRIRHGIGVYADQRGRQQRLHGYWAEGVLVA